MNKMEQAALLHVREQLKYERSPQAAIDRAVDKRRRAELDRKLGHSPRCSLLKCAAECPRISGVS